MTGGEKKRPVIGGQRPRGETTIRQMNMILEITGEATESPGGLESPGSMERAEDEVVEGEATQLGGLRPTIGGRIAEAERRTGP